MKNLYVVGFTTTLMMLCATPVVAQTASHDPQAVEAGSYKVEPYHTQVGFSLSHFGFTEFNGLFGGASGLLVIDPTHPAAAKLEVSLPVDTLTTTVPKLEDELKGDQWFDAGKFPTATFVSTRVTPSGKGAATIFGNLTLHGVTRPVVLMAQFVGAGVNPLDKAYTVGFHATGTIRRSDFGVKMYLPMVGDDVHLTIEAAFERQG